MHPNNHTFCKPSVNGRGKLQNSIVCMYTPNI
jgi:hypothetical protein